jgi:hypothetical protein
MLSSKSDEESSFRHVFVPPLQDDHYAYSPAEWPQTEPVNAAWGPPQSRMRKVGYFASVLM